MRVHHLPGSKIDTSSHVRSDINVTPLVDVCLVLLIIFMVVTPLLQKGVDVQLPETVKPEKMAENEKQLNVSIKADGSVYVRESYIPDDNLEGVLAEVHSNSPDREVIVKGDRRLQYKRVREVMRLINEAGFTRVGLVTEQKQQSAAAGGH
jgi:biopolymer transport protein TolR